MRKVILWDLDGTLTDPRLGITRCIQHALKEFDHPVPAESDLLSFIGPPLHISFQQLLPNVSERDSWMLVDKYRERFSEVGLLENHLYGGIERLLQATGGLKHYVATSKPHTFASRIIDHFNLATYFNKIYGSELDGTRSDKSDLIDFILTTEGILPEETIMIGDRKYDVIGGKNSGLFTVGVTWGYGSLDELVTAGADVVFDSPEALQNFLLQ